MGVERIFVLVKVTFIVFSLLGAVEYFKYSTKANYEWFHCTPQLSLVPNTNITQAIAVGGPSCDRRGQLKSITKKLARSYDPNNGPVAFCIKENDDDGLIIGYASTLEEEDILVSQGHCSNIIHW